MPAASRGGLWVPEWHRSTPTFTPHGLLLASALITLGFFAFFAVLLWDARQDAAHQSDQAALNMVAAIAQDVGRNIELFDESLQAASDGLQLPGIWELSPQIRNLVLFNRAAKARYLGFINVLSEAGDVIADSRVMPPRGGNFAGTDYFIAHRRDPRNLLFIGGPIMNRPDQPTSITISRRISHPDGSFAGVVVGSMHLAYVRDLFARLKLDPHATITLLRTDGTILMRQPLDSNDIGSGVTPGGPFHRFMLTREARIDATAPRDNLLRQFTFRQIGDLPLVVSVGFAVDDVFAAWRAKAIGVALGVGALCLINLSLTFWLRRQFHARAIAEAERRRLIESVSDVVMRIDADGVCRHVSPAAWRVFGIGPRTLVGQRFADMLHPEDRDSFTTWLTRLQDGAADPSAQFRARHPNGTEVWIEAVATRLTDAPPGQPQNFVVASRDVTARHELDVTQAARACDLKRSNAELDDLSGKLILAADAADAANQEKSRFLQMIGHEIRTPLTSILANAELLCLEGALDPTQTGRVATIRSAGEHLNDVLNRLLDQAQMEGQAAIAHFAPLDLPVFLEQTRAQIEPEARAKQLGMRCEIDPDVPHQIVTDATHLRQILLNFLQNAVKFTDRGEIVLRASREADRLRCCVVDSGRGVPADLRVRLFREHARMNAEHVEGEGTGLGLAISAGLVRALGGSIGYMANPDGGSVFWIELSLGMKLPSPFPAASRAMPPLPPLRVLVVDDSDAGRDAAACLLRNAGVTVIEAANGEDAIRLAAAEDFAAILMDMRMPGIDGLQATRGIRALPGQRGQVAIIAVTAQVLVGQGDTWAAAGINDYVAKPYNRRELLAALGLVAAAPDRQAVAADQPPARGTATAEQSKLDALTELATGIGADRLDGHLRTLSDHIATLLAVLRHQDEHGYPETLMTLVHTIAGDAGQLGFAALAAAARAYMLAADRHSDRISTAAATLLDAAAQTEDLLHQRLSASRNASMTSAKLA